MIYLFIFEEFDPSGYRIPNFVAEPKSGFRIAFNMFDTDGNERVDKTEFLVVKTIFFSFSLPKIPLTFICMHLGIRDLLCKDF